MTEPPKIQCHYDILGVARDADQSAIKKCHRKLALKYHPDKNVNDDSALEKFRLVQEAYECLSDPSERKWYDDHRESILAGWKGKGTGEDDGESFQSSFMYDVVPYMMANCFCGFGDDEDGFFAVYSRVFRGIFEGESAGWLSDGNLEDMPHSQSLSTEFGVGSTPWGQVSRFYKAWENFSSVLNVSWSDKYDVREADNRRVRRLMEEENKKTRKATKKKWNETILALFRFVKRRDPRVITHLKQVEIDKKKKEVENKLAAKKKKEDAAAAREMWRANAQKEMDETETNDLLAGKFRLADLNDDDDDYDYGGNNKKGKKKKRNRGRKKRIVSDDENEDLNEKNGNDSNVKLQPVQTQDEIVTNGSCADNVDKSIESNKELLEQSSDSEVEDDTPQPTDEVSSNADNDSTNNDAPSPLDVLSEYDDDLLNQCVPVPENDDSFDYESSSSEEEEPVVWRCECCRKTFKSEKQLENHFKSKKHREAEKKFNKR
mmetsp:Transcript_7172/g.8238  ORF Transcript_7172/g.8238 Transcript_7172/m.8238 type:complete len:490 (-) Transcript_7172:31-1500(-)